MRLRLPAQRLSTVTLAAVYPWMAGPRMADTGTYIGTDRAGSAFCYDPWTLYQRGILTNPNMLVAGQVGSGKSALVKTLLWRGQATGRKAWVIDPKGEYHTLAAATGITPLRLGGDSTVRINPLDPGSRGSETGLEEVRRRQAGLVATLASTLLGRPLAPVEHAACDTAITTTASNAAMVSLPRVVDALLHPSETTDADAGLPVDVGVAARDVGLALRRLVAGDLAGILDAPTSHTLNLDAPLVVVDLSALADTDAEPLVMLCVHHWLTHTLTSRADVAKTFVVLDEAWRVLRHVAIARWLRASWKLARAWGVANIAVIHRLTDLAAAGPAGSEQARLAAGVLADSQTRIVYAQPADARDHARTLLDLSEPEADALPRLPRGRALWHVGDLRAAVDHHLAPAEAGIVDTDQRGTHDPAERAAAGRVDARRDHRPRRHRHRARRHDHRMGGHPHRRSGHVRPGRGLHVRRRRHGHSRAAAGPARRRPRRRWRWLVSYLVVRTRHHHGARRYRWLVGPPDVASGCDADGGVGDRPTAHRPPHPPHQRPASHSRADWSAARGRRTRPGGHRSRTGAVGQTAGLAIPAILEWDGPVLATSVRTDLVDTTYTARGRRGRVWVYDPTRTAAAGHDTSGWDPLAGCADWQHAQRTAAALCSAGSRKVGGGDGEFWYAVAAKLLAPLMFAAAYGGWTMADVVRWVDTQEEVEVRYELEASGNTAAVQAALATWHREARTRSSAYTTAEVVLAAFQDPAVLASTENAEISSDALFDGEAHTLYVCAPAHEQDRLRPLFTALLAHVIRAAYTRHAAGRPLVKPLLIVLDEAANIAPLRDLDAIASTAAGCGIQLVTVWQDLAQIQTRYGQRAATVVNNHRAKLVLSGVSDEPTLRYLTTLIGDHQQHHPSVTVDSTGRTSTSTGMPVYRPLAPAEVLRRIPTGHGLLIYGHLPPARLQLRPWYRDRHLTHLANGMEQR